MKNLKRHIFESRLSGKPIELKRHISKRSRTAQLTLWLKYGVMKIYNPIPELDGAVFIILNDAIVINGIEFAAGQKVMMTKININKLVEGKNNE